MLCQLAQTFPARVAEFLERDIKLSRNFREESVTDVFMASLIGLEPFGIRVDFPDEPTTGGDMEWIFAAPLEANGGRYLRLILQAKRAKLAKLKSGDYWYYHHLDHGDPKGSQAQTLISHASSGAATLPLYVFYHPRPALTPAGHGAPAVEGINLVFASVVAPVVDGGCDRSEKKISYWRPHFMPLSDFLCWPIFLNARPRRPPPDAIQFSIGPAPAEIYDWTGGFHPDIVANRIARRRRFAGTQAGDPEMPPLSASPGDGIPGNIQRAIDGEATVEDQRLLQRPRVIFSTNMQRSDPRFEQAEQLSRSQRD